MITKLYKSNKSCACGCGDELPRRDRVNKLNGKYYKLHCGKMYRLLVESNRRIRMFANQVGVINGN